MPKTNIARHVADIAISLRLIMFDKPIFNRAKKFIDANVWDGEDRIGAKKKDWVTFTPDDLQELIFELIDEINK